MNDTYLTLMAILRSALHAEPFTGEISASSAEALFHLADIHSLLPVVVDAVCARKELRGEVLDKYRGKAVQKCTRQLVQYHSFLSLLEAAQARGADPVVVKGILCRALYPKPYLRLSVDDDLFACRNDFLLLDGLLREEGLRPDEPDADPSVAYEISYHKEDSPLYIELHRLLFSPDSASYGDLNRFFEDAAQRTEHVTIENVSIRTLSPTDHLLFLLLHAFKHFLHAGTGVRPLCDIALMTDRYRARIDWQRVYDACEASHAAVFAGALFRIAERYLGFEMPEVFSEIRIDETDLLRDLLSGGLFGTVDGDRMHSSTITLDAVSADKEGRKRQGALAAAFPSVKYLEKRYPYLVKRPYLLPAAWAQRGFSYLAASGKKDPQKSLAIGKSRVELLREYGIISRKND